MLRRIFRYLYRSWYLWRHGNESHLFRGTSVGFPGGDAMQQLGITSTTTDPLVAVLFALESARHGSAGIVQVALGSRLADRVCEANNYQDLEREVAIEQLPAAFGASAEFTVPVDAAREMLLRLGFQSVPSGICDKARLHLALVSTPRLEADEIRSFLRQAIRRAI